MVVKPGVDPPKSVSLQATTMQRQKKIRTLVLQYEVDKLWDSIQAKDVPPELIDYVQELIAARRTPEEIRKILEIPSPQSAAWKKIMSAFNQGYRVNGPALIAQMLDDHMQIGAKLKTIVDEALDHGTPAVDDDGRFLIDKNGEAIRIKGPTKELAMIVDSWGRNNERFLSTAMKTGMLRDPIAAKAQGGGSTTIVVQNNIPMPSVEEIKARQAEMKAKALAIEVKKEEKSVESDQ